MSIVSKHIEYQPFFVVGPLRSGTTLLRLLIDHHPKINCFGEFEGAVSQSKGNAWPDIEQYWSFVETDRQTQSYNFSINKELDYECLVRDFFEQMSQKNPSSLVGASVHSRMDLLPKIWPKAKFIKLFRDPRDVANSCIGMGWVGNVYKGADYWIDPEIHWDALKTIVPDNQLHSIWYEELVSNPELELSKVCDFLGCDYDPEMLRLDKDTTYAAPDSKYAWQWKEKLTEREVELVESKCGFMMESRKYDISRPEAAKPVFLERLKLLSQSRLYRIRRNIKNFGFLTWLLFVISKKTGPKKLKKIMRLRINEIERKYLK